MSWFIKGGVLVALFAYVFFWGFYKNMDHGLLEIFISVVMSGSVVSFLIYGIDKLKAERGSRRIPERVLLVFGLVGFNIGAVLGQALFRHKIRSIKFKKKFFLCHLILIPIAVIMKVLVVLGG